MEASNAIIFEGATADEYETTLSIVDPTADHTQYLINQGGYIPVLAAATTTAISSTPAELNIVDGGTSATSTTLADADRLVVNDNGTMVQVALTDLETYMETSLDTLSNVTTVGTIGAGVWQGTAIASTYIAADAITGAKIADDAIDSEHYTDGSIDADHIAANAVTSAKIAENSIVAREIATNSLTAAHIPNATNLTLGTVTAALTGDVTGNASGTAATVTTAAQPAITSLGTLTTLTVDNVIINGTTIGHTGDTDLMTVASGVLTVAGEVDATSLDISGDADIDGTLETDNLTVGGAQGTDGQVLTSTGSGVGWEDAGGGISAGKGIALAMIFG
jgi:hypothetical protein